jgi:Glycosyl transferase family 2
MTPAELRASKRVASPRLRERIAGIFDRQFYLETYQDVSAAGLDPFEHYIQYGLIERRSPNAEFMFQHHDSEEPGEADIADALLDYLDRKLIEATQGKIRDAFDPVFYLEAHDDVAAARLEPFQHYLQYGLREGRSPNSEINLAQYGAERFGDDASYVEALIDCLDRQIIDLQRDKIGQIFDRDFYLGKNHDVAAAGQDPFQHYIQYGAIEGRSPSAELDLKEYKERAVPDVGTYVDALLHYIDKKRIAALAEQIREIFDKDYYLSRYGDVRTSHVDPLQHFLENGLVEGRWPNVNFDPDWYRQIYLESEGSALDAFSHYLEVGRKSGSVNRLGSLLDTRAYMSKHLSKVLDQKQGSLVSAVMTIKNPIPDWMASVNSVIGQSYKNFELIVVCDCGANEKDIESIARQLSGLDGRIQYRCSSRPGRAAALNEGLRAARGEWLCYLDCDNWWDPHFIAVMLYQLRRSGCAIAYCDQLRIYESQVSLLSMPFDLAVLRKGNFIDLNAVLHSRGLVEQGVIFNEKMTMLIDYEFIRRIAEAAHDFEHVPAALSFYDDTMAPARISNREDRVLNERILKGSFPKI